MKTGHADKARGVSCKVQSSEYTPLYNRGVKKSSAVKRTIQAACYPFKGKKTESGTHKYYYMSLQYLILLSRYDGFLQLSAGGGACRDAFIVCNNIVKYRYRRRDMLNRYHAAQGHYAGRIKAFYRKSVRGQRNNCHLSGCIICLNTLILLR